MPIARVDGFYFHPGMKDYVLPLRQADPAKTPWAPVRKPLSECAVTLVSSAGIHLKGDAPFDLERERREPTWGDPTHREIPRSAGQDDVEYTHMHVDTSFLRRDRNVAWPVDIFLEYERQGKIGRLAGTLFSIYGYVPNFNPLVKKTAPRMIARMKEEDVDAVFLFPV
ncbi:MAG: glycine/sarcosine/betaine reductase selenoprotein B family protein [Nitrospinota bacterium]